MEVSKEVHGGPWRSPRRLMELCGGLHGVPDNVGRRPPTLSDTPWRLMAHGAPWRLMKLHGDSVEASMDLHGGLHGGPWRFVEVSMEVRGAPWRFPWRSVEVRGGLHGGPWSSVEVSMEAHGAP